MHYIIFDLEATCWEDRAMGPNETIEIGAVRVNEARQIESEFQAFIRPKVHPQLSTFCQSLTSITQANVDSANSFPTVAEEFKAWIGVAAQDYRLCSWGHYDKKQLERDCALHGMDPTWVAPHLSLKHQYAQFKHLRRPTGMKQALEAEGLPLRGTHHRGIDDARNIAQIFLRCFDDWTF